MNFRLAPTLILSRSPASLHAIISHGQSPFCDMLIDYPYSGVARSDICTGLRSKPHGSYVIFYNVSEPVIRIERILHGARDIGTIFSPN